MSKTIVSLIALIFITSTSAVYAYGPDKHSGMHRHGKMGGFMMEKLLDLTEEQAEQIKQIRQEARAKGKQRFDRKEIFFQLMDLDPSADNYQQQVDELAKAQADAVYQRVKEKAQMHAKIYTVLTPEQIEKARSLRAEMKDRMNKQKDRPLASY